VAACVVSTRQRWTDYDGAPKEATEWFTLVAWGPLAEEAGRRLQPGQRLYAEGHVQTRSWTGASGERRLRTELVAERLIPMDGPAPATPEPEDEPGCLNRVMVIGNLGRDPEMRYTPDGQAVTWFSLAATRSGLAADGERHEATEWFNVVSWGSLAEICNKHLTKGRRIYVEGELRTRTWHTAEGKRRYRTELVAEEMILLGPRRVQPEHVEAGPGLPVGTAEMFKTTGEESIP
jgi:single-strand DNA-binding protein